MATADINQAVVAIEAFLRTFTEGGAKAVDVQVRASGDDVDVIKAWCDLGPASIDVAHWTAAAEAALAKAVPAAGGFRVQIRAEKL